MDEADLRHDRILILAPIGRDALACADVLRRSDMTSVPCPGVPELVAALQEGAGAAIVAEEALFRGDTKPLVRWVDEQPPWSDMPFVILTSRQDRPEVLVWRHHVFEWLRNASFLERPLDTLTLASAAASAIRSRHRQYEMRAYVAERAAAAARLEEVVVERTRELRAANDALHVEMAERERAEEALRQSQKMEAVGQLTGGLAHDFNNLLTAVKGSLELVRRRLAACRFAEIERYIDVADSAAARAAALTHRLLAFSRRQTLEPKPTDINRLVSGLEELIRRTVGPHVEVDVDGPDDLWLTEVDQNQLENALLNLCINARDAMPDGGRLILSTANCPFSDAEARDRGLERGEYVSLNVADTGIGMSPITLARAFDPFFTTKPLGQGTGLGLSMVYGFARQSGGHVRIRSEVGAGTTVSLFLPRRVAEDAEDEVAPLTADAPQAGAGETVLVVDDEATVRMLVTDALTELGCQTIEAADGPSGLKILQSDAVIDLMVTDVGLPGGMNGRQVADAARNLRPGLKVLFITGYAESAAIGAGHLEPGMHVLTKPFSMETLSARITRLLADAR